MRGKVLNIVSGAPSGALNIALTIARDLKSSYDSSIVLRKYNRAGIEEALVVKDRFVFDFIWKLSSVLRKRNPDVVLVHGYSTHLWTKLAAAVAGKSVIHVEHNVEKYTWLRRKILQWTDRYTKAYVCVSRGVARHLAGQGADPEKIRVIYNGIQIEEFAKVEKTPHAVFTVGMTARFSRQKDHMTLIKAIEHLIKDQQADVRLILQGNGKQKRKYMDYVKRHALEEYIIFETGPMADLARKLDLFVLSTHYEGMGLVLVEAMAAGLPVIGTDVPGVNEIIENGVNGYLVPGGDWQTLAEKISTWQQQRNTAEGRQLINRGRQTVAERFAVDRMCREYRELIAKVLHDGEME